MRIVILVVVVMRRIVVKVKVREGRKEESRDDILIELRRMN